MGEEYIERYSIKYQSFISTGTDDTPRRIDNPDPYPFGTSNIVAIILEILVLIVGSMGLSSIIYTHVTKTNKRTSIAIASTVISGIIYLFFMVLLFFLYSSWKPQHNNLNKIPNIEIPFMGTMNTKLLLLIMCVCFLIYLTTTCLGVIERQPGDLNSQSYAMIVIACVFSFIPLIIMFNSSTIEDKQSYSFLAVFGCAFASLVGAIIILAKPNIITVSTTNVSDYKKNSIESRSETDEKRDVDLTYYRIYLLLTGLSLIVIIPLMRMMVDPTENKYSYYILIAIESLIVIFSLYQIINTPKIFSSASQGVLTSSLCLLSLGCFISVVSIGVQIYCHRNKMLDTSKYERSLFAFKMGLILIGIADTVIGYNLF